MKNLAQGPAGGIQDALRSQSPPTPHTSPAFPRSQTISEQGDPWKAANRFAGRDTEAQGVSKLICGRAGTRTEAV